MSKIYKYLLILIAAIPLQAEIENNVVDMHECGLSYIQKSIKVAKRTESLNPPIQGNELPVFLQVTEIPASCYEIIAAYVWWTVSYYDGSPDAPVVSITNSDNKYFEFPSQLTGQDGDKCWEELGTRGFRANVTEAIKRNGTYRINVTTNDMETDGITLMIIYKDLSAPWEGHLIINDGLITTHGIGRSVEVTGINTCGESARGSALIIASDLQGSVSDDFTLFVNNVSRNVPRLFWNFEEAPLIYEPNMTSVHLLLSPGSDCYSIIMAGAYYRTDHCKTCSNGMPIDVSADKDSICPGTTVTLSAKGAPQFQWFSDPPQIYPVTDTLKVNPTVTTIYYARGLDADNCLYNYDTVIVHVLETPKIYADEEKSVCDNIPVVLETVTKGGLPPYTYSWEPDDGLSDPNSPNPSANPDVTTTYVVTVTDANGCVGSDMITIKKGTKPIPDAGSDQYACTYDSVSLEANVSGGLPPYEFDWSPGRYLSDSTSAVTQAKINNNTDFILKITDAAGCISYDTVRILCYPQPYVNIAGNRKINLCNGDSAVLTTETSDHVKFKWSTGDSTSSITVYDNGFYYLSVESANGCKAYDTVEVNFNSLPDINIKPLGPLVFCEGDSVVLKAEPYDVENTNIWSTGEFSSEITVKEAGQYYIAVQNIHGCKSYDTVQVTVMPPIEPEIVPENGQLYICNGNDLKLQALPDNEYYTYKWSTGDTTSEIVINEPGIYSVEVELNNKCTGKTNIEIKESIMPEFSIIGESVICNNRPVILSLNKEFTSYLWSTGDSSKNIVVNTPGKYSVVITDSNRCQWSAAIDVMEETYALQTDIIDFDSVCINSEAWINLNVMNTANKTVTIENAAIAKQKDIFTIGGFPYDILPGQTISIPILFRPTRLEAYSDTLIITTMLPCKDTFKTVVKGAGIIKTIISLPELFTSIGERTGLNLTSRITCGSDYLGSFEFESEILFDATVFVIDEQANPEVRNIGIFDGNRILNVKGTIDGLRSSQNIQSITGTTFLGEMDITPLRFGNFNWQNKFVKAEMKEGSITISGLCLRQLSHIRMLNKAHVEVFPNPAGDKTELKISGFDKGDLKIEIISVEGTIVKSISIPSIGKTTEYNMDMTGISNGLYNIVVSSGQEKVSTPAMVVK